MSNRYQLNSEMSDPDDLNWRSRNKQSTAHVVRIITGKDVVAVESEDQAQLDSDPRYYRRGDGTYGDKEADGGVVVLNSEAE